MAPQVIWKKALLPQGVQSVMIPYRAKILCAREQGDEMAIWFTCNPEAELTMRHIVIVPTGGEPPTSARFLGTCSLSGGALIYHVFELI